MEDLGGVEEVTAESKDAVAMDHNLADNTSLVQKKQNAETGNLWDDIERAFLSSVFVYGIASIREFARRKGVELMGDPDLVEKVLNLPVTGTELIKVIDANAEELQKALNIDLYLAAIQEISKQQLGDQTDDTEKTKTFQVVEDGVSIVVFDDANNSKMKNHLIYAITVDKMDKKIKVAFRGSVTIADWVTDTDVFMVRHSNPLKSRAKNSIPQSKNVGVHAGFKRYLFGASKHSKSKYDTILQHLDTLFEQYPDYSLLATGHSLGAALATLFTFQCGGEDRVRGCITCVTFASPYVGDGRFFRAFQELEASGKVRHLRVANHRDIITKLPRTSLLVSTVHHGYPRIYRHVGVELKLFREGDCRVSHPTAHKSRMRRCCESLHHAAKSSMICCLTDLRVDNYMRLHSCSEYMDRLDRSSTYLKSQATRHIFDL